MEKPLPPVTEAGFYGMMANSRAVAPSGYVSLAQNFYLDDGVWQPRPGMFLTADIDAGSTSKVTGMVMFETLAGVQYFLVFAGGFMYEYNFTTNVWTKRVPTVTIDSAVPTRFANSRGRLIGTDGVNRPFMLEVGAPWTWTELTAAPISKGVRIYYDKAVFYYLTGAGAGNQFEWSNEGDPTAGYAAVDQAWDFAQTDFGRIIGMASLNELMNILKQDSASMLLGAIDDDFQTNAVREGLSETEGTVSIDSVQVLDGNVYCWSAGGPRVALKGQRWQSLHHVDLAGDGVLVDILADELDDINKDAVDTILSFVDNDRGLVGWLVPRNSGTNLQYAIVYHTTGGAFSVYKFDTSLVFTACATIEDPDGKQVIAFGTSAGRVYLMEGDSDNLNDSTALAIEFKLRSRAYGAESPTVLKRMVELSLGLNTTTELDGEVRPVRDDADVGYGRAFGRDATDLGRRTYRRGFNHTGFGPGWEFYLNNLSERVAIERAVTTMTLVGVQSNW